MKTFQSAQSFLLKHQKTVKTIQILMYLAGIIGLQIQLSRPYFQQLVSFNLWVSLFLLLLFHQNWDRKSGNIFLSIAVLGFIIEVIGVKTGKIFGQYQYGNVLGVKLLSVPVAISANWLMLSYLFCSLLQKYKKLNTILKAVLVGILLSVFDVFIEQVAIRFGFWSWEGGIIPFQNYLGWFFCGFFFSFLIFQNKIILKNNIAQLLLILQIAFFLCHNLIFLRE